jgi:hypothetical protein
LRNRSASVLAVSCDWVAITNSAAANLSFGLVMPGYLWISCQTGILARDLAGLLHYIVTCNTGQRRMSLPVQLEINGQRIGVGGPPANPFAHSRHRIDVVEDLVSDGAVDSARKFCGRA